MRAANPGWTEERVSRLTNLWRDGLSASQIATHLGGVSRNAVIGKLVRLGLTGGAQSKGRPRAVARQPVRTAASDPRPISDGEADTPPKLRTVSISGRGRVRQLAPPIPLPGEPATVEKGGCIPLVDLRFHHCRWPIGDPQASGFGFCAKPKDGDRPYCAEHARIAYLAKPAAQTGRKSASELIRSLRRYV